MHVEVLNHALRNVPADRVRMHVCWGNYEGPHHHDVPLEQLLPVVHQGEAAGAAVRGRQPAPRARVGGVPRRRSAGRQDPGPGRAQHHDQLRRAPAARRRAHRAASPTSSAASASSPAPTAASAPSPASAPWTRTSPTSSSARWSKGARHREQETVESLAGVDPVRRRYSITGSSIAEACPARARRDASPSHSSPAART